MSPQTLRLKATFPLEPLIHRAAGFFSEEQRCFLLPPKSTTLLLQQLGPDAELPHQKQQQASSFTTFIPLISNKH